MRRHRDLDTGPTTDIPITGYFTTAAWASQHPALAAAFTEGSANDWLAVGFVDGHRVSKTLGVVAFAVFLACMTVGRILGTGLLDRFGRVAVLRVLFRRYPTPTDLAATNPDEVERLIQSTGFSRNKTFITVQDSGFNAATTTFGLTSIAP